MRVVLEKISHALGATPVLKDVSFAIEDHELFFLLGPSGCGKTTLLRLVAGFYQPDMGRILFGDREMNGVPPHHRNTGMVFQNYALWPHMTVAENVAYGLEVRGMSAAQKRERVAETLSIVQMEDYAERSPNQLSGGQQQRVALARALVVQPDVLLLDEPLSNLDAKLRLEMREEIRRIHARTRITTLYVTHDQKEALSMAGRMAVMRAGRVEQIGAPRQLYRSPASRFVADFMGEINWLSGTVTQVEAGRLAIQTSAGPWVAQARDGIQKGQQVWMGFRPEAARLAETGSGGVPATIAENTFLGEIDQYQLTLAPDTRIKVFEQNAPEGREPGATVTVHVAPENLMIFPAGEQCKG
jgi:iron(III) transport system ATP-binding protein